jgi:hypothetical protein
MTSISLLSNWQPAARLPAFTASRTATQAVDKAASSAIVRLSAEGLAASKQSEADKAASSIPTALRFKEVGAAMLNQFKTDAPVPVAAAALTEPVDNKFTLSIVTRSGVKVDLTLGSLDDETVFQVSANAELSKDERSALSSLATGFQAAIDGMTMDEPQIRLGALAQFNSKFLQSVDFHAEVEQFTAPPSTQTLDFHADGKQRKVSIGGASGKADVSVDTSKLDSLGTKEQQTKAINSYLKQFDQARVRGHGDARLMTMFKDAFSDMSRTSSRDEVRDTGLFKWALAPEDNAALTGLADFSASVTQATKWDNPMRPAEVDGFAYEVSQDTQATGERRRDGSLSQTQTARLSAQYHEPITKGVQLNLGFTPESQNYRYHQIDDTASSRVDLGYKDGGLIKATLQQSVSQSDRVQKYVLGKLVSDTTTPGEQTLVRDLMSSLAQYQPGDSSRTGDESREAREERRQQSLATLSENIFLLGSPGELAGRVNRW